MNRFVVPAILVALVALLAYGLRTPAGKDPPNVLVGKPAPVFALQDLQGRTHDLGKLTGKPVVINFWASWCVPCRDEAPLLKRTSDQYAQQAQFLGIIYSDNRTDAQKFMDEYGLTYPSLLDPGSRTAMKYGIGQVPVTYVLDGTGKVVYHKLGPVEEQEFLPALQKAGVKL